MVDASDTAKMYATKRRRRSVKTVKPPMKDPPKSNPSKRHRERLNSELDHLASLLPFEQSVISKLDKLSILRLAVSYLRTKSYFQTALHERYALDGHRHHIFAEPSFTDTDTVLQALSGFMFVVTCDGEVFFSSRSVEQYLGFHQSDIIHQSALELIHSEDREEFKTQLNWRSMLPADQADMTLQQVLLPENSHLLHRCFTVRFRCLLDNTSGFITLEISGRIKIMHGQNMKGEESPPMALFALCCPFGPLPLLDVPPRDYTFKSKHKMDMAPLSMDPRGKLLFGHSDRELMDKGGYDLIHPEDLSYYSSAHQELIKTGSSGLIAYRLHSKDFRWIWLQTSSKVVYKNSKPDFIICTHRHLTEDEGRDLVGKRGSEFKLPYPIIDTDPSGLGASFEEEDVSKLKNQRNKKSKTQLRDYLQAARKRKTPYRDVYGSINGYAPYGTGINGYPACQDGQMKTEFMYPYAGNNFAGIDPELYRASYPFTGGVYPTSATEGFRLEDKHSYTNGYYLEPRQYQHTLQYHGNGYTDLMAQTSKYGYDMSKYGYDMSGYGLDLTKRGQYDTSAVSGADLSRFDSDYRKYDYGSSADKLGSRVNGGYDSLRTGPLYGTSSLLNNDQMLPCSVPHNTTSCSLYPSDISSTAAMERYSQNSSSLLSKDNSQSGSSKLAVTDSLVGSAVSSAVVDCKQSVANGHASVIRNASPRNKSSHLDPSSSNSSSSSMYTSTDAGNTALTNSGATSWPDACKLSRQCSGAAGDNKEVTMSGHVVSPLAVIPDHHLQQQSSPLLTITSPEMTSRIVSPAAKHHDSSASPVLMGAATSVIQCRSTCDKQQSSQGSGGGIAVPVVKSSSSNSSWLNHLSTPSYDWHLSSAAADSYANHQRSLRTSSMDTYPSYDQSVASHPRAIVEAPKFASVKVGETRTTEDGNPLLSFSEVTHTLLSSS